MVRALTPNRSATVASDFTCDVVRSSVRYQFVGEQTDARPTSHPVSIKVVQHSGPVDPDRCGQRSHRYAAAVLRDQFLDVVSGQSALRLAAACDGRLVDVVVRQAK
jgi:hypothetical protein